MGKIRRQAGGTCDFLRQLDQDARRLIKGVPRVGEPVPRVSLNNLAKNALIGTTEAVEEAVVDLMVLPGKVGGVLLSLSGSSCVSTGMGYAISENRVGSKQSHCPRNPQQRCAECVLDVAFSSALPLEGETAVHFTVAAGREDALADPIGSQAFAN